MNRSAVLSTCLLWASAGHAWGDRFFSDLKKIDRDGLTQTIEREELIKLQRAALEAVAALSEVERAFQELRPFRLKVVVKPDDFLGYPDPKAPPELRLRFYINCEAESDGNSRERAILESFTVDPYSGEIKVLDVFNHAFRLSLAQWRAQGGIHVKKRVCNLPGYSECTGD